jgi:hypothetical protein
LTITAAVAQERLAELRERMTATAALGFPATAGSPPLQFGLLDAAASGSGDTCTALALQVDNGSSAEAVQGSRAA